MKTTRHVAMPTFRGRYMGGPRDAEITVEIIDSGLVDAKGRAVGCGWWVESTPDDGSGRGAGYWAFAQACRGDARYGGGGSNPRFFQTRALAESLAKGLAEQSVSRYLAKAAKSKAAK